MKIFNKLNRKAESRLLTPFLFIMLGLIGISIVLAVLLFYSKYLDTRGEEARIMSNKIIFAVSDSGYLNQEYIHDNSIIFRKADIKESFLMQSEFYFNITVFKDGNVISSFSKGNKDFEKQCFLPGNLMAKCYEKKIILLNKTDPSEKFQVRILTGCNQVTSKI